jgi:hypothetical protein
MDAAQYVGLLGVISFWGLIIFARLGQIEKACWDVGLKVFKRNLETGR